MRILVAEPDPIAQLILRRALDTLGHECVAARGGLEAWALCEDGAFDVIVSDWPMTDYGALELCRRVRASAAASRAYIVLMAPRGEEHHVLAAIQAGADDLLAKPVDIAELEAKLIAAGRLDALHRRLAAHAAEVDRLSRVSYEAARVDAQTLVGNRVRLREDLETLRARASRYGHTYVAALCGIDHFKAYNDLYGLVAGDETLRRVANAVRGVLRGGDTVYRYAGDEFLVILPEQTLAGAAIAMERVRRGVEELGIDNAGKTPPGVVTLSTGIAPLGGKDTISMDDWLKRAGDALRDAKAAGRNRVALL